MAIRNDININWDISPRQVTVLAPSIECTMQDLLDTLRYQEALSANSDEQSIVEGSGKVTLDTSGNKVGLTVQLINATVGFESRPGPTWVECALNGGNLSGLEADTVTVTTVVTHNNPYVNINKTSSVSATFAENKAIQFSSFNGGVTVDTINGSEGTLYDIGTPKNPAKHEHDAIAIAELNGFTKVYVKGDIVLSDPDVSWLGFEFIGESSIKTEIDIDPIADVFNCEFYDCTVKGTLDGNSQIQNSIITDLEFVDGFIYKCAIGPGVISLGTSTIANIFSCYSTVAGVLTPIIDFNETGILALRDYNGGILLRNYNGNGSHSIDLSSGQVKMDTTITSGTFVIRGIGKLVDINGKHIPTTLIYDDNGNVIGNNPWNGGVTIINELLNNNSIASAVWNKKLP